MSLVKLFPSCVVAANTSDIFEPNVTIVSILHAHVTEINRCEINISTTEM